MSQQTKVAQVIHNLILSIRPNATETFQNGIKNYCKKVFSSTSSRTKQINAQDIKDKIINRMQQTSDSRTVNQCQQTINKILLSGGIQKKAEILQMLLKTSDLINNGKNFSNVFQKQDLALNQTQQTITNSTLLNENNKTYNNNLSSSNYPPPLFTKPRNKSLLHEKIQSIRNRGSVQQDITESQILTQITFVLQNLKANLIELDTKKNIFELNNNVLVSQTVQSMVTQLCDVGWFFKKIIDSLRNQGSIEKSLYLAVQEQLNQYYRWLAIIQNFIKQGNLSLRKFASWSYEPLQKLKWLTIVLQSIGPNKGCKIITKINSYRPHGTLPLNDLFNRLLAHLVQPLLHFMYNWMYRGQLIDVHKQFFVEEHNKVNQRMQWYEKFSLIQDRIPNILDRQSAIMIFNAGKTIYFLKNRCKCNYELSIPFIDPAKILSKEVSQSNILSNQFNIWLKSVYEDSSSRLVKQLKERFNLKYHLQSMKYFYLIGKGDFIQQLVDTLKQQLNKAKHLVYEHTLDGYISDALSKSFQDFRINNKKTQSNKMEIEEQKKKNRMEEGTQKMIMTLKGSKTSVLKEKKQINFQNSYRSNIVDRLLAKKISSGQSSWDSFNFQYSMDRIEPLYSIFTPQIMEKYQQIFQFLWKIKRIQQLLKQIWQINQKEYPKIFHKNFTQFSRILHRCHILRTSMSHFLNNLFGYLMIAIQSAWNRFFDSFQKSLSLDQIIKQHRVLHYQLQSIVFLNISKKNSFNALINVFKVIQQFRGFEYKLTDVYNKFFEQLRQYQNRKRLISKGNLSMQEQQLQFPAIDQTQLQSNLQELKRMYEINFKTFYDNLKREGQSVGILIFRLDFSQYYTIKQMNQTNDNNMKKFN